MALFDTLTFHRWPRSRGLFDFARHAAAVRRQRAALQRLDDAALKDLGLTRNQADTEAKRPIWDVPETWRTR